MKSSARAALALMALVHLTCNQAILTAPTGSAIFLSANPPFIEAHGGVSVVSALVMEETGTPVADGTVVQFFTDLGRIDEQGKTNDGVARVNLISDSRSGTAHVTAVSGPASAGPFNIDIGSIRPTHVIVTANPPRIPASSRTTHITANVIDANGNPVPNVPVIFRVTAPATGTEFMESGGTPIFTDTNGQAEDILRTRRAPGAGGGPATVEVVVLSGTPITTGNTVQVPIE